MRKPVGVLTVRLENGAPLRRLGPHIAKGLYPPWWRGPWRPSAGPATIDWPMKLTKVSQRVKGALAVVMIATGVIGWAGLPEDVGAWAKVVSGVDATFV